MKILFLSRWFPYPTDNGSKIRIFNLLRGLSQLHDVTLLGFSEQAEVSPEAMRVLSFCKGVQVVRWREFNPESARAKLGFLSLTPRSIIDTFSPEMAGKIQELLAHESFDLIIASQLQMAAYADFFGKTPAIFEELELGLFHGAVQNARGIKPRLRHTVTWFKLRMYLSRLLSRFEACTVASAQEKALLAQSVPSYRKPIEVIPNGLSVDEYRNVNPTRQAKQLVFSGSFRYHANYTAMQWFVRDVYPTVLKHIPDVQLTITGDHANLPLPSLQNIRLAGYVDDIKSLIASSAVSIAPLQSGGGTRLKILEAMAVGTPVVSTSKGAEGLDAEHGKHLLVADEPAVFAENVVQILQDDSLRHDLAVNAGTLVREKYDWGVVLPRLLALIELVVKQR